MECREREGMTNFLRKKEAIFDPQASPDHSSQKSAGSDNPIYVNKTRGYCWSISKYRNWCAQHAFFEGKKAPETFTRKSISRTLTLRLSGRMASTIRGTSGRWKRSAPLGC